MILILRIRTQILRSVIWGFPRCMDDSTKPVENLQSTGQVDKVLSKLRLKLHPSTPDRKNAMITCALPISSIRLNSPWQHISQTARNLKVMNRKVLKES